MESALVSKNKVIDKDGILLTKEIADKTVWDTLAEKNPTHAVISAENEADAAKKSQPQIEDIKKYVDESTTLLDLGCGYGRAAKYLLPQVHLQRYVGLDSSVQMLQIFKQRYESEAAEQRTPLTLVAADIHTLPLEDQSVDAVLVGAVFLHNHKSVVDRSLEEVKRVLKPDGTLLVYSSFPRAWTLMGLQGLLYQGLLNLLGKPMKNGPVRYYSKQEVTKLLDGFTDIKLIPHGFAILPKTIILFPGIVERVYRLGIANPVNALLQKILPKATHKHFAMHFDVVAKR